MKIAAAFLFTLLLSLPCFPQKYLTLPYYNVDSLLQLLPDQQGEERVNSLNCLAVMLFYEKTDLSIAYTEEAMNLAKELDYDQGIADAFRNWGYIYQYQGNFPKALDNYIEALSLCEELDLKHTVGWIYYDIARTHFLASNYEKTIEYGYKALDVFRERKDRGSTVGDVRDTVLVYGGLALAYRLTGDPGKAVEMNRMVLDLMNRNHFEKAVLAIFTWSVGYDYHSLDEIDSAKAYMHRTLAFPDENMNIQGIKARTEFTLGQMYRWEGNFDSALYYYQKADQWYRNNGILFWAGQTAMDLGWIYFKQNDFEKAENYLKQSVSIFNEMLLKNSWYSHDSLKHIVTFGLELFSPMPPMQMKSMMWEYGCNAFFRLYKLNETRSRTAEALKYHIAYSDALDTLNLLNQNMAIIELQTRYETEQKEKQIALLAHENEFKAYKLNQSRIFIFGLAGLVLLIAILAVIIIRMNTFREKQISLLLQQKLLRSQMNPHFIFNSLVSIQNFILNEEPAVAGKYLSKFSKLVRNILDSSFEEYIPLEEEISTIENYLDLQKVRYSDKFDYSIDIDPDIDNESMMIPPMLAQPFIENAIEHGIKHKEGKGRIGIRCWRWNDVAIFEVEDDGVGREKAMEILQKQDKEHKSLATAITKERIAALNRRSKKKITLEIIDLKDDLGKARGTLVRFGIPLISPASSV
jgi:tetratricopeptide (TPR) repeat protein